MTTTEACPHGMPGYWFCHDCQMDLPPPPKPLPLILFRICWTTLATTKTVVHVETCGFCKKGVGRTKNPTWTTAWYPQLGEPGLTANQVVWAAHDLAEREGRVYHGLARCLHCLGPDDPKDAIAVALLDDAERRRSTGLAEADVIEVDLGA